MTEGQFSVLEQQGEEIDSCPHHWVIQEADGPQSAGICRLCGAVKEFNNYLEASYWGDDKSRKDSGAGLLGKPSRSPVILEEDEDM